MIIWFVGIILFALSIVCSLCSCPKSVVSFNKWMNFMSDCGAALQTDLSDLSSASKVFTTWTEFHVVTDQLPNIVPWCCITHTGPQWLHRQGFHFGALPWSFHLSPNHPLFSVLEKNAGVSQIGSIGACWIVWQHLKQSGQGHMYSCVPPSWVKHLKVCTNRHFVEFCRISPVEVCWHLLELVFTCLAFSKFPLWDQYDISWTFCYFLMLCV